MDDVSVLWPSTIGFHSISNRVKNTRKKQGSPREVHLRVTLDPTGRGITILRWPHPAERNTAARLEIGVESPMFVRTIKRADRGASWCHFPRPLPERDIKGARTAAVAADFRFGHGDRGSRGGAIAAPTSGLSVERSRDSRAGAHEASDRTDEGTLHSRR